MIATPTEREAEGIWTRLRRRKVVQWGVAYVAGAWGLLQGIGFVADAFNWPDATKQVATLALLIGLPIVLVLAWYHGDRGEQHVRGTELAIITLLFLVGGSISSPHAPRTHRLSSRRFRTDDHPFHAES